VFESGTNHYRNREASWFFSDPPDKARDSALNLDDFLHQHAGIHPMGCEVIQDCSVNLQKMPQFSSLPRDKIPGAFFACPQCLWKYINAKDRGPFHSFNSVFAVVLSCTTDRRHIHHYLLT
jgi:hypothetical protein